MRTKSFQTKCKVQNTLEILRKCDPQRILTCSIAKGYHCSSDQQRCTTECDATDPNSFCNQVQTISSASDWKEDLLNCEESETCLPLKVRTLPHLKKLKCLYKRIVTCGIQSDDHKTPCKEHGNEIITIGEMISGQSFEAMLEKMSFYKNRVIINIEEATKSLEKYLEEHEVTEMCSIAEGSHCSKEKFCTTGCSSGKLSLCNYTNKISHTPDWAQADDAKVCVEMKQPKCSVSMSTQRDVQELKCLYKKIVTCGISEEKGSCTLFDSNVVLLADEISGVPLEELRKYYLSGRSVKEAIKWLKEWEPKTKWMCSMSLGMMCVGRKCVKATSSKCSGDENYCRAVKKIAAQSDWNNGNESCTGDNAGCEQKMPMVEVPSKSRGVSGEFTCLLDS